MLLANAVPFRHAPRPVRSISALVWLAFIVFPLLNAIGKHGSALHRGLIIAGAALFVGIYSAMVVTWRLDRPTRITLVALTALLSVASALTLGQSAGWGFLFTYCAACTALVAPKQLGLYAVALCTTLAAVTSSIAGADGGSVVGFVASSAGIGMLMLVMGDLRLRNAQLSQARAELAQMAVAQERERFARDLHDLLGHSLSVIALKAELAGRMLASPPADPGADGVGGAVAGAVGGVVPGAVAGAVGGVVPGADTDADAGAAARVHERAATEVREIEQVARTALGEVRDAVSGYRQPTLEGELAGARMALSAAGIEADVQHAHVPLDPAVEAVLAWTVREGATNVIRHSRARHCTLRITASLTDAGVEVIDDGVGETTRVNGNADRGARGAAGGSRVTVAVPGVVVQASAGNGTGARASGGNDTGAHAAGANGSGSPATGANGAGTHAGGGNSNGTHAGGGRAIGGHGIAGLAERARLVNGTIEAGCLADGGYRLTVIVPVAQA